jgi:hypothetical protein
MMPALFLPICGMRARPQGAVAAIGRAGFSPREASASLAGAALKRRAD